MVAMGRTRTTLRNALLGAALAFGLALVAMSLLWCRWVYGQIERYADRDEAAQSDAIVVFGAAEYDGRPSPVFRARLDHALMLYRHGIAPLLITLGGDGGDEHSEGSVGRTYLMGQGVAENVIIVETESRNTEESAERVAVIARANALRRLVIVSDGSHLFRIHAICAAEGLDVLTSPRPRVSVEGNASQFQRIAHEIASYTLWRLHLH
jgi:uncharacterized SAM-binding protein YcdF (DUF218 family)